MKSPLMFIEVAGERREVLFTPSLYNICARKGWIIELPADATLLEIQSAYVKLFYAAAMNAYEVRKYDNPSLEFDLTLLDVEIWATLHPKECANMIRDAFELLQGKTIEEAAKEIQEKEKDEEGTIVKKKSISSAITHRLRRFWSGRG